MPDDHSRAAGEAIAGFRGELYLSGVGELELHPALELRVFRNQRKGSEADGGHAAFEQDVARAVLVIGELEPSVRKRAGNLILSTDASIGCRTADILPVAWALECGADSFFTVDDRQKSLARK